MAEVNNNRLETGVTQCDDDWPGVFIRGDDCAKIQMSLQYLKHIDLPDEYMILIVQGLNLLNDILNGKYINGRCEPQRVTLKK